jgi:hypothetical protein
MPSLCCESEPPTRGLSGRSEAIVRRIQAGSTACCSGPCPFSLCLFRTCLSCFVSDLAHAPFLQPLGIRSARSKSQIQPRSFASALFAAQHRTMLFRSLLCLSQGPVFHPFG